jgi:hypothetical protein
LNEINQSNPFFKREPINQSIPQLGWLPSHSIQYLRNERIPCLKDDALEYI